MKAWPDWDEFLRRLREDPVFREEVRRQVLTEDLLNLPAVVQAEFARAFGLIADLTEQVRENSWQIASLTERMERVEGQMAALTERMERAEAQIQENGRQIAENSRQIASLTEQVRENSRQIAALTERMDRAEAQIQENGRQIAENSRQIASLTEQVRENSRQIAALTERMERAEAQIQENGRQIAENSRQIASLTEQVRENSRQIAALTKALRDFQEAAERRFAALEQDVRDLKQGQARLEGTALEVWWTQYAPSYLGRWFRKVRVLTREALNDELEAAEDEGRLTAEDAEEVRRTDVVAVARDRKTQEEVWVVVEVSATVGLEDVTRAKRRADILARLGRRAVAIAAGREARPPVRAKARGLGVWVIEDGRRTVPDDSSLRQTSE
jgi:chromosome segregation ATPase